MTDTYDAQAQERDITEALAHPSPDPETLPDIPAEYALQLQAETAGHLVRAILRQEESVASLEMHARQEAQAWANVITKAQARADAWRAIIRDFMLRNNLTKLQSPWSTTFVQKGRTKKVVLDEAGCIAACKTIGYAKAIQTVEKLVKKELDVIVDTKPEAFKGLVEEHTSEPTLVIRNKE